MCAGMRVVCRVRLWVWVWWRVGSAETQLGKGQGSVWGGGEGGMCARACCVPSSRGVYGRGWVWPQRVACGQRQRGGGESQPGRGQRSGVAAGRGGEERAVWGVCGRGANRLGVCVSGVGMCVQCVQVGCVCGYVCGV